MKRATIIVSLDSEKNELLVKQFEHKIPKEFKEFYRNKGQVCLPMETGSPELEEVLLFVEKNQMRVRLYNDVHYTKKELAQTQYFHLLEPAPLELEGTTVFSYGTQYLGGCPRCGFGRIRVGDVLVDRKFVRKAKFGNLIPELYVTEELKNLFIENQLTGASFESIIKDFKGRDMPRLYSMQIHSVLPPLSESTCLVPAGFPCCQCGQDIVYLQSDLQYEKEKLLDAKDFNLTNEYLNNWRVRNIVVSAKVRNLLKAHKIWAGRYTPVVIF